MYRHQPLSNAAFIAAAVLLLIGGPGCKTQPEPTLKLIPANGFMQAWRLDLKPEKDELARLYLRDDTVFAYSRENRVYAMTASGGELVALMQPVQRRSILRPPIMLGDKWIFPTIVTLEVFTRRGQLAQSIRLDRATRGPGAGYDHFIYIGQDSPNGGRLAKIDVTRAYARRLWEVLTFGGVSSTPAVTKEAVFAASEDGAVRAIDHDGRAVWNIDDHLFQTDAAIVADLKVDDKGVYVASMDSKLYCLDLETGRIRWTYYATTPLRTSPYVVGNALYIAVQGKGLVAIDTQTGKDFREPLWIAPAMRMFLSADDKYVYALSRENTIVALDRATGEPKFKSTRNDLEVFASNEKDSTIYAATRKGEVIAVKPVLKPGTIGTIVLVPLSNSRDAS